MRRLHADLGLMVVALIWGSTFPVVKVALESMSPFAFNTVRFFIACLFFLPFLRGWDFKAGFKIGIASFLGYTFQTVGLEYTTATNAGFITSTYVVLAPIISWLVYKDLFDRRDVFGVFLAFIGFYFLSGYSGFNFGDILMLFCALFFGAEIAMISHYSRISNPTMLAFWQSFAIFILSAPFAAFTTLKFEVNTTVVAALLITAFFATFVAKMLQNWLQSYTKSSDAAVILSLEGVFSHLFSVLLLTEMLSLTQYFGAFLILVAVIIVSLRD
ncbi:DMT family transporter [Archaeoglobus neptunius]|uniref:DMT family transporter n=1 Tax=Archaeoglobus neptunius TaxID=2798580 RepID=UPI001925434F|nr:DMT family transporter [Archaeoglobus neptunius]